MSQSGRRPDLLRAGHKKSPTRCRQSETVRQTSVIGSSGFLWIISPVNGRTDFLPRSKSCDQHDHKNNEEGEEQKLRDTGGGTSDARETE